MSRQNRATCAPDSVTRTGALIVAASILATVRWRAWRTSVARA
jgi:hypothetical protein